MRHDEEIVFQAICVAIVDDVDTRINLAADQAAIMRHACGP